MTKELEALERLYKCNDDDYTLGYQQHDYNLVKQALQRLEALENAKPSEALESMKNRLIDAKFTIEGTTLYSKDKNLDEDYKTIKQALLKAEEQEKVLEIIKNKKVNVANLIDWFNNSRNTSYEGYLSDCYQEGWFIHFKDNDDVDIMYQLTEDEFDTLKRYFK